MHKNLTELSVDELLTKFGAGNHKPGSGSACAFNGMMSAKMLLTVISLTNEPKRHAQYGGQTNRLSQIAQKIEKDIFPRLQALFQQDSEQFDKVIHCRMQRDAEKDPLEKRSLSDQQCGLLRLSTEIPIDIAGICLQLIDFAEEVFDYGFQSARGDAAVALNDAMAGVLSSLSIVELNLLSLPADDWMEKIVSKRSKIRESYNKAASKGVEKLAILEEELKKKHQYLHALSIFQQGNLATTVHTEADLENLVREFQNLLWVYREHIWKKKTPDVPLQVLQPRVVLEKVLGYAYYESDSLGTHEINGEWFETAGIIDKQQKSVRISRNFPATSQRFSLAHELAHAVLHDKTILHRDKSIDGPSEHNRSPEEWQADKFATFFLMPETSVRYVFENVFHMPVFKINGASSLALGLNRPADLRTFCQNQRGLARLIAQVNRFGGKPFKPLIEVFGVSVETMAIRLEELQLIEF